MSNRIAELRKLWRMTQSELAILLEVSRNTVSNIEVEKYLPSLKLAFKIAYVFNMKVEDIFYIKDSGGNHINE